MNREDIESSILSSFIFSQHFTTDEKRQFVLNVDVFSTPLKKRIAQKINESEPFEYDFLSHKIEESISGTKFEEEFIVILSQSPMPLSTVKLYHDDLVKIDSIKNLL